MTVTGENQNVLRNTCPSVTLSTADLTRAGRRWKPGFRCDRPLSHATATILQWTEQNLLCDRNGKHYRQMSDFRMNDPYSPLLIAHRPYIVMKGKRFIAFAALVA